MFLRFALSECKMASKKIIVTQIETCLAKAIHYQRVGNLPKAKKLYQRILSDQPNCAKAWVNLGVLDHMCGYSEQGLSHLDRGLALEPHNPDFLYNKAGVLEKIQKYQAAIQYYQQVLRFLPRDTQASTRMGYCYLQLADYQNAMQAFRQVLSIQPHNSDVLEGLGKVYFYQGSLKPAVKCFNAALKIKPDSALAYSYLGQIAYRMKNFEEAVKHFKKSIQLDPKKPKPQISLAMCYLKNCYWQDLATTLQIVNEITDAELAERNITSITPFKALSLPWSHERQLAVAKSHGRYIRKIMQPFTQDLNFQFTRQPQQRLRIAYLSADFRDHNVAHLIQGVFAAHNRSQFEIFAYSSGVNDNSDYRNSIIKACDHFTDIHDCTHQAAARKIYEAGIHILVDLSGYTEGERLGTLALRPAPIQAHYLGYLGTLGTDFIDYLITDRFVTPPKVAQYYTEEFVYMPNCHQINSQHVTIAETPTREACGLPDDGFVFCSFNNNYKIEPIIFKLWMELLAKTPKSVLWLYQESLAAKNHLQQEAKAQGIDPSRLVFANEKSRSEHIARHRQADLYLDTLSTNARTSASDALLAGLPILTCPGQHFSNRVCGSLLSAIGMPELIATDLDDYKQKALSFATHHALLKTIRVKLADKIKTGPLFDTQSFTRHLEQAYQKMWANYCDEQPPQTIQVSTQPELDQEPITA